MAIMKKDAKFPATEKLAEYLVNSESKWKQAIRNAFPDYAPPNIVMTADTVREDQEKLRRAIEEKQKAEMQDKRQSQADALRAMAAQQQQQLAQQQYGASSFPYTVTSFPNSIFGPQETATKSMKPKAPTKPEKTTEQAQEELTGMGRRKIILDGENNP